MAKANKRTTTESSTISDLEGWSAAIRRAGEQGREAEAKRLRMAQKAIEATRKYPDLVERLRALIEALDTGAIRVGELLPELRILTGVVEVTAEICGKTDEDGLQWIDLPPNLGGERVKVIRVKRAACPKCGAEGQQHLELESTYHVAECVADGFVWFEAGVKP